MATQTLIEKELAELIVGALNLDADPQTIEPNAPLYLEGLGLDSIDLLELSVVISKKYGFQIKSDDPDIETIFLMPHEAYAYLSSRLIKEVAMLQRDISAFVPNFVVKAIREKIK